MDSTGPSLHPPATPQGALPALATRLTRRSLRALTPGERTRVVTAQVESTRPIISGVILSGATVLALIGLFEAVGIAPGIGYPWWVVEVVALTVAGCAIAIRQLVDWRPRLLLAVLSTVLVGVFMSIPPPGVDAPLPTRTGLFQLMPIALLALMARKISCAALIAAMLGLAWLRVALHGGPTEGQALYWLNAIITVAFGLLLGAYRTDFAVGTFRIRQKLHQQAITDALTGLLNRAGWNREADEAYAKAVSRALPVSIAFFDIDHFKRVNDVYGHDAGDRVLQALGQIVRERLGPRTIAARMGGEEFVVLFIDHPGEAVEGYVQRVRHEFEEAAIDFGATVSAGVAHRQPAEAMAQHLRRADIALYEAKTAGRDRMVVARA